MTAKSSGVVYFLAILSISLFAQNGIAADPCESVEKSQEARRKAIEADYQKRIDALNQALKVKLDKKGEQLKDDQKAAQDLGVVAGAYLGSGAGPAGTALGAAIGNAVGKGYVVEREDRDQEIVVDIPEVDPKGNRIALDLPQIEMRRETKSLDVPEVVMVDREIGRKPVVRGLKVEYEPIIVSVPETRMVRKEIHVDIPTVVMKRVESFTPTVRMKRQPMKFKMPTVTVRSTTEASERIVQAAAEIQGPLAQLAAEMQAAISKEIATGLKELYRCKLGHAEGALKLKKARLEELPIKAETASERNALVAEIETLKAEVAIYKQLAG